ncbi:DoxX family protein [Pseudonocardia sp. ICBG1142]|uniref:DoxX family protein n=1 Tax=Pseudonocardia sp. ICBG1142 TaxID=2846760 RepID=UPI001CF63304|nr:DoxX family protein [Pseudonocardia sp. ICBG1142]
MYVHTPRRRPERVTSPLSFPLSALAQTIARLLIGGVLIAHGIQKALGFSGIVEAFTTMGIPLPTATAAIAMSIELVGGLALLTGTATTLAGLLVTVNMLGAVVFVHSPAAVFVDAGGWELVGVLAAGALLLAATGPGPWSVDALLTSGGTEPGVGTPPSGSSDGAVE